MKVRGWRLKYALKEAFADLLPPEILSRGKQGFAVPLGAWFRGELKEQAEDLLLAEAARHRRFLRGEYVKHIYQEHQARVRDWGQELWALMNFEVWLRTFRMAGA